jgi:phosphatidylglycerophosphate synthase
VPGIVILMREMLVSGLREYLGPRNVVVHVTQLAKWKTTSQLVALAVLFLVPLYGWAWIPGEILFWIAGILTAMTGYDYFKGAWPHLVGESE